MVLELIMDSASDQMAAKVGIRLILLPLSIESPKTRLQEKWHRTRIHITIELELVLLRPHPRTTAEVKQRGAKHQMIPHRQS